MKTAITAAFLLCAFSAGISAQAANPPYKQVECSFGSSGSSSSYKLGLGDLTEDRNGKPYLEKDFALAGFKGYYLHLESADNTDGKQFISVTISTQPYDSDNQAGTVAWDISANSLAMGFSVGSPPQLVQGTCDLY